jgi:hypothetical protein
MKIGPIVTLALLASCVAATGQSTPAETPKSVAIVELFTSEGCSSCPPADALLQRINLQQTSAGQLIVGISEHVTYWNDLGWKDPYAQSIFTDRQAYYASRLSLEGSYTPQMVLNGQEQFVGSDSAALEQALRRDARKKHLSLKILSSNLAGSTVSVDFSLLGPTAGSFDIVAVLTDDADKSNVIHGENAGRLLQHVSVARSLSRIATVRGDAQQSVRIPLPNGFLTTGGPGHHLILFAQEPHQGAIVAAATVTVPTDLTGPGSRRTQVACLR